MTLQIKTTKNWIILSLEEVLLETTHNLKSWNIVLIWNVPGLPNQVQHLIQEAAFIQIKVVTRRTPQSYKSYYIEICTWEKEEQQTILLCVFYFHAQNQLFKLIIGRRKNHQTRTPNIFHANKTDLYQNHSRKWRIFSVILIGISPTFKTTNTENCWVTRCIHGGTQG